MKIKVTFEKLPDGTQVITVKGKNVHGDTYIRQEIIDSSAMFDALKEALKLLDIVMIDNISRTQCEGEIVFFDNSPSF